MLKNNMTDDLAQCIEIVRAGKVIAYPTEAVYGLGCDAHQQQAVEYILALKQRPMSKGLICLVPDIAMVKYYTEPLPVDRWSVIEATWPGHVTWLFPANARAPIWLTGGSGHIALRLTAHPLASALTQGLGGLFVSTSANRAGQTPLRHAAQVAVEFKNELAAILIGDVDENRQPSEIRDALTGKIIRF